MSCTEQKQNKYNVKDKKFVNNINLISNSISKQSKNKRTEYKPNLKIFSVQFFQSQNFSLLFKFSSF